MILSVELLDDKFQCHLQHDALSLPVFTRVVCQCDTGSLWNLPFRTKLAKLELASTTGSAPALLA